MGTLTTDQLIYGLRNGRPLAPFSIQEEIINAYIKIIQTERMVLRTDSEEVKQLVAHIKEPLSFISPVRRKELGQCEIYVLPFPLCMAYAEEPEERGRKPRIVIGNGLVDLIANTIFLSHLHLILPSELDHYYLLNFRKDMSARELFTNALFLLHLRFFRFCEPLPNIFALMTPEMIEDSLMAVNGALLFTLLHELGHHKLNHFEPGNTLRPTHYQFAVKESLSTIQQQELEADQFAADSLIERAKVIGTYWHHNAVAFFVQMELVSGNASDDGHPMALNRCFYSDSFRNEWGQDFDVTSRPKFFKTTARRFLATKNSSKEEANALIQTSREGCLNILQEICTLLLNFGLDLTPMLSFSSPNWLKINPLSPQGNG